MNRSKEIFRKISRHLLTQNERSMVEEDCFYRQPETGLSCAIGCLIDNDHYSVSLEGQTAHELPVQKAISDSLGFELAYEVIRILMDLQHLHDYHPTTEWVKQLDLLADEWFNETLEELGIS